MTTAMDLCAVLRQAKENYESSSPKKASTVKLAHMRARERRSETPKEVSLSPASLVTGPPTSTSSTKR